MKSFGDLVKQAQKMQKQVAELQEKAAEERYESSAGGGMVRAVVDGRQMLKELTLSPEAFKEGDATLLEDLILTAVGEAQRTSQARMQETLGIDEEITVKIHIAKILTQQEKSKKNKEKDEEPPLLQEEIQVPFPRR